MVVASPRRYLAERAQLGIKLGLETVRRLLGALGDPQAGRPALLIAGTNGKGSVVAYVAAALRAAGLRPGAFTSPHLQRVNERIAVGTASIGDAALDRALGRVAAAAEALVARGALAGHPSYFEVLTAAALLHFAEERVDVAVLEVGLGGRLDATNVVDPIASAIVSISRDHEAMLGRGLAAIAREKAGVLRSGRTTVLGPLPGAARRAILERAAELGARLVEAFQGVRVEAAGSGFRIATPVGRYGPVTPLPGRHQLDNAVVAVRLLEAARSAGLEIDLERGVAGLSRASWPGRIQRVTGEPALLLDGAHNPAAARALARYLAGNEPAYVLLFGAMADKDVPGMARALFPRAREVVFCRIANPRAASPAELARRSGRLPRARARAPALASSVGAGLDQARLLAGPEGLVVVAGSLFLVGEVMDRIEAERRAR